MKKLFTIALLLFSAVVFSQQLPSRQPDHLPSRFPAPLASRQYQQPKVKIKGDKVIITMSKEQYLRMERMKQMFAERREHGFSPRRFKPAPYWNK